MAIRDDLKRELQKQLHNKADEGFSRLNVNLAETDLIIEAFLDSVKQLVVEDHELQIVGFGKFVVKQTKERMGTHPKTHEPMLIESKRKVVFEAGKDLKNSIN